MVKFCYASFNLIHTANYSNGYRSDLSTLGDTKHKLIFVPQPTPQGFYFHLYPISANTLVTHTSKGQSDKGNCCTQSCAASTSLQSNLNRAGTAKLSHQGSAGLPPPVFENKRHAKDQKS